MRHDRSTVLAIGVIAALSSDVVHELFGHGGVCILAGGRVTGFSTSMSMCNDHVTSVAWAMLFHLGGMIANVAVGTVALAMTAYVRAADRRYALWTFGTWQIWMTGAYLVVDSFVGIGDFSSALQMIGTPLAGRVFAIAVGILLILASRRRVVAPLSGLVSGEGEAAWLCCGPWLAGNVGVLATSMVFVASGKLLAAGLVYQVVCGAAPALIPWLLSIPVSGDGVVIARSAAWRGAAAAATIFTWVFLATGIRW